MADVEESEDLVMGAMYGEPQHCTKSHPCCCCTLKQTAKACSYVIIVIAVLKLAIYALALIEPDYWYKSWYNDIFGSSNKTEHVHTGIDGKDPEAKFARKCYRLFIVLLIYCLFRIVASLVVICIKRPSPVPFLIWILVETFSIIISLAILIFIQRYITIVNEELGMIKVDKTLVVSRLSVVLGFEIVFIWWFMWIMGANAAQLDHRAQASVFRAADLDKLVNKRGSEANDDNDKPENDEEPIFVASDPRKFEVTAPGYVDTW